jgi:hypothetical protein
MSKNRKKTFHILTVFCLVGFCFCLLCMVPHASAKSKPKTRSPTGGITISPAFQELVLGQRQSAIGGSFSIANNSDQPETFEVSSVDMGTLEDTGGVILSGLPQDYQQKYGLAKWLKLSATKVTVKAHNKSAVSFSVKNEDGLSPGGHYGALVVRSSRSASDPAERRVALSPQAASLLFLKKVGGERYGLRVSAIDSDKSMWHMPTKIALELENTGNVHVVPRGIVRIKNTVGHEIARGIVNPESGLVLPERSRTFSVPLTFRGRTVWPGRYTIEVEYRYDGQDETAYARQSFFTANLKVLVLLVGAVVAIGTALYKFRRPLRRRMVRLGGFLVLLSRKITKAKRT